MKKLLLVLVMGIFTLYSTAKDKPHLPFAGKTKHKTVKCMTKRQVRKAQKGKTFYYRKNHKLRKRH